MQWRIFQRNEPCSVTAVSQSTPCSNSRKHPKLRAYPIVAAALLAAVSEAHGALSEDDFADMPLHELMGLEVFHAASLLPTKPAKAPGTVYSFSRDDFVRLGVRRLDDLLQFVPGMQLNQYRKRHRTIWARGLIDRYNDKLVLMVDGIRTRHLYYNHFSLGDNLPLEKIEKVEVILGPASSLYGANAFGGIISVTTRDFSEQAVTEAAVEAGDNERGKVGVMFNSPKLQAFASYLDQQAPFRDDRKSFISGDTVQPLDEDSTNLFLKASPAEGLTFSVDYQKHNSPFVFIPDTQDAFVEEELLTLGAMYEAGDLDNGKLEGNFYYTRDRAMEYELEQVTQTLGYKEYQHGTMAGVTVTGLKRMHPEHVVALGAAWQYEHADNTDYIRHFHFADGFLSPPETGTLLSEPNITNNDYAIYLQDVWDINPSLNLTLGGRYDDFEQFGAHTNYRGALVYSPTDEQSWKFLYGTAIRTPSFREYLKVIDEAGFVAPVPDPERITSWEIAYHHQWRQAALAVTFFDNRVEDYIHEAPTPMDTDEYFTNSENEWHMRGIEALLRYQPSERISVRVGLANLQAEEQGSGDLPYLAAWNGSLNLNYRYRDEHQAGISLFYNSEREETNSFDGDTPDAFTMVNLSASGRIDPQWQYQFGVDNLFDAKVYDPAGDFGWQYNTERSEREIWLRLTWKSSY